jgi:hypothetical protein
MNSVKCNDARNDAHVCFMTRLIIWDVTNSPPVGKISSRDLTSLRTRYQIDEKELDALNIHNETYSSSKRLG